MSPVKISTAVISYNQEEFIRETLDGVLNQTLDAEHEIVCGDDASTDNTRKLIDSHPQAENLTILSSSNNLGMHKNWARTIESCSGEYIAICEGDDVWVDSNKLQKQINLLEQTPDASACFTNANVVDQNCVIGKYDYVDKEYSTLDAKSFFELNFNPVPTCTIVFRKSAFKGFPPEYYSSPFADWILHTILIQHGPYVYLPEKTSSYRQHSGGIWTGIQEEKQLQNKLRALNIIHSIVLSDYKPHVKIAIGKQIDKLLYFYRDQKNWMSYFKTWIKLKML